MPTCETCGNSYDKAFNVIIDGDCHTFDSFECAIHKLAPACEHCGCRVIGHGVARNGQLFCCDHCAQGGKPHAVMVGESPGILEEPIRHPTSTLQGVAHLPAESHGAE